MDQKKFSDSTSILKNFQIQKYYQNEPRFNEVFSRDNLPNQVKDGAYVISLDEYADTGTHQIALFCKDNEIFSFNSFGVEQVPEETEKFTEHKNIKNIFRTQSNNPIMCRYCCIGFIDFMFIEQNLIDYTSLISPYDFKKIDITKYFKDE